MLAMVARDQLSRWLAFAAASLVAAQDPLAGSYFDGGAPPPLPPQGMRPGGFAPEAPSPARGGGGFGQALAFLGVGAGAMKVYDISLQRRLQAAHDRDTSKLQTAMAVKRVEGDQLLQTVQSLKYQVQELQKALYESEAEALQRDYEEFKAPDVDDDDSISIYEFGAYIKNYMKAYPHIPERDYPTFDDFDQNGDGTVTFKEWQHYLQKQKKADKGSTKQAKSSYADLSTKASETQSFQQLYERLKAGS